MISFFLRNDFNGVLFFLILGLWFPWNLMFMVWGIGFCRKSRFFIIFIIQFLKFLVKLRRLCPFVIPNSCPLFPPFENCLLQLILISFLVPQHVSWHPVPGSVPHTHTPLHLASLSSFSPAIFRRLFIFRSVVRAVEPNPRVSCRPGRPPLLLSVAVAGPGPLKGPRPQHPNPNAWSPWCGEFWVSVLDKQINIAETENEGWAPETRPFLHCESGPPLSFLANSACGHNTRNFPFCKRLKRSFSAARERCGDHPSHGICHVLECTWRNC